LRRGIPRRIVDSIFRDSEDTDRENALRLADKKLRILGRYPRDVAKRRLYNLLLRRGYSSGMIIKVLQEKMGKEEV
jgi:SOS response regulatory protein OraA/RecX